MRGASAVKVDANAAAVRSALDISSAEMFGRWRAQYVTYPLGEIYRRYCGKMM